MTVLHRGQVLLTWQALHGWDTTFLVSPLSPSYEACYSLCLHDCQSQSLSEDTLALQGNIDKGAGNYLSVMGSWTDAACMMPCKIAKLLRRTAKLLCKQFAMQNWPGYLVVTIWRPAAPLLTSTLARFISLSLSNGDIRGRYQLRDLKVSIANCINMMTQYYIVWPQQSHKACDWQIQTACI